MLYSFTYLLTWRAQILRHSEPNESTLHLHSLACQEDGCVALDCLLRAGAAHYQGTGISI